ncbi:MAG: hypothetical protein RJQ01_00855 [Microcella sp.]|uniref:hypothetical protein n=1 Tax=Microcella sp. TaxID=1913979 RepID=UPI003314C0D3
MKTLVATAAMITLSLSLAGCAASVSSGSLEAGALEGTWIGDNLGYEGGEYQEREIRFVIDQSTGSTFSGEKSWREVDGEWSEPESFSGNVLDATDFHAVDDDGYIVGTLVSATTIQATYLEAGVDAGAFALTLEKVAP